MRFSSWLLALTLFGCATSESARSAPTTPPTQVASPLPSPAPGSPAPTPAPMPPAAGRAPETSEESAPVGPETPASASPFGALPWLGISMDAGGDLGVRVEGVIRGSPAERGGVRIGDRVVSIDGARVATAAQVSRAVAGHKVGETITVGLERAGNPVSTPVVLAARPATDDMLRMHLVGAAAPAWTNIVALSGAPASISALKGRVVILDFWASWCGPCRMIAPRLSQLRDRLGAQGLSVIGITTDPPEQAAVYAQQFQMRYPTIVDKAGDTSRAYNITALPTLVLIDKSGVVREVEVGFGPNDPIEAVVRKLLAEPGPAATPVVPAPAVSRPNGR